MSDSTNRLYAKYKRQIIAFIAGGGTFTNYTAEQARDDVGAALRAPIGLAWQLDDPGNTITLTVDPQAFRQTIGVDGLLHPTVEFAASIAGKPVANQRLLRYHAAGSGLLNGGVASSAVPATNSFVATIKKNGTAIGTITWASGATGTTVAIPNAPVAFARNDIITVEAPANADPAIADLAITLTATR